MGNIFKLAETYNTEFVIIMVSTAILNVILLISFIVLTVKVSKMQKRYKKLVRGNKDIDMEELLLKYGGEIDGVKSQVEQLNKSMEDVNGKLSSAIQRIGFVRYNAFEDRGYELSFSIALLDELLNGIVITSIYHKDQSICYAKPVKKGRSTYPLTVEEMQSIDRAIKGEMLVKNYR